MKGGRVARRYARAAFDLAVDRNDVDGWVEDLRLIQRFLALDEVAAVLDNPAIPFERKLEVIDKGLSGIAPLRRNFVCVLVENGRVGQIDSVLAEFQRLVNEHRGITTAEVVTAVPLDDAETDVVARRLEALLGKKVVLEKRVDPSLIGGMVARVGDHLIDGSIAGQLTSLRDQLMR